MNTGQPYSEEQLVAGIRHGDKQAEFLLYQRYVDAMYHTAIRMVTDPAEAQDIVQESFIKVFAKIGSYRGEATIGAWIKRVVVNTAINSIRRNGRRIEYPVEELPEASAIDDPAFSEPAYTPAMIHQAIKQLPDGCRTVLNLYALEGYSHKEIADVLNITESTSKTQYRRGKLLLKSLLTNPEFHEF